MSELPEKIPPFILDSNESPALFITHYTKFTQGRRPNIGLLIPLQFYPIIDWKNVFITYYSSGINSFTSNDLATSVNSVTLWDEEEEPKEIETVLKVVPPSYHQYLDVLSKVKAEKLPPHCACDHHIQLEGLLPPVGVIYSLSNQESEKLQAYISGNVEKGFIMPSSSSAGVPVLFVKKKDGGICLCVDYLKINSVDRKKRYCVPPMNQILTVFNSFTIFSKIDLHGAYNLLRIKEGDEHLNAFDTKYGSCDYWVIPFGLNNAPEFFHNLVSDIFSDLLDIFAVVYLDDIMVFSSSEEENVKNLASVLQRIKDNNLFAKASKCVFHSSSVE
ncbi:hypothetical protein O181_002057 [Austropuccinia psidii MF-1]|uniref:Reverse transcriptase domain-containing protein n=1 Tax=Austropuccinia psidii MF-1 TaxID=1389203 RepID=A0A9Q3GDM4_9BASI|nr:hypothetical protein [Austropuccinia psidii MF-1]